MFFKNGLSFQNVLTVPKKRLVMANLCKSFVRSFATSAQRANAFNHVTVIGGGLMGSGIAQVMHHNN